MFYNQVFDNFRKMIYYNNASALNSRGQCLKKPVRGKSGLHRAKITANGRRGRPQG